MKPFGRFLSALAILLLAGALGAPRGGLVYANNVTFVVQTDPVSVPEGSTAVVNVKLSGAPKKNVTATAIMQGTSDPDLTVTAGGTLTFTTTDWSSWHPITVTAAEDSDQSNGTGVLRLHKTATNSDSVPDRDVTVDETDNDRTFVVQADPVAAPEGGTATVNVKLSAAPSETLTATASFLGTGDADLTVTGGSALSFTSSDWNSWHAVTVSAAEDDTDTANGSRTLQVHKTGGFETPPDQNVTVNEADDDVILTLSASPAMYGSTTPSGAALADPGTPLAISTTRVTDNVLTQTRVTVDEGTPVISTYGTTAAVSLPGSDGLYKVKVEVKDDLNTWSDPAEVMFRLESGNPALVGTPEVIRNAYGVVVLFNTNRPCFAELRSTSPSFVTGLPNGFPPQTSFALAAIRNDLPQNFSMTIHLSDEASPPHTFDSDPIPAPPAGVPRSLFVAKAGSDATGDGTDGNPWATLQHAVDRALPGDTVTLKTGAYFQEVSLTHGGYDDSHRLVIQGQTATGSIITGGRRKNTLIRLTNAPYVTVRQLTYMYFRSSGINATSSDHLTVEDCISYNGKGWVGGIHVVTQQSPYGLFQRNLAIGGDYAFAIGGDYADQSSHSTTIKYNTVSQTTYAAVLWIYSAAGSVQTNNSFTYTGNDTYVMFEVAPGNDLLTFTSDYNNIGTDTKTTFVEWGLDQDPNLPPDIWQYVQSEYFAPFSYGSNFNTRSKHLMGRNIYNGTWTSTTYWTLGEVGVSQSGLRNMTHPLEVHSIFLEPLYENPNQPMASWDWRLKPASPNVGAGENGTNIGALGVGP